MCRNLARTSIRYLLTTTVPDDPANIDTTTWEWWPPNLALEPTRFPVPLALVRGACTEQEGRFADTSLGLWRIADLPVF